MDRKTLSEERPQEENWLASFPEKNPNPILEISLNGCIEYTNPAIRKEFPTLLEQQTDHPYLLDWGEIAGQFQDQPDLVINREVRVGEEYYQQSIYFVEEYQRLRMYGMNIPGRKRLEAEIQGSEKKYRELVQYAPVGIYELDFRTQKFLSVNDAMCILTGYSRDELMALNPMDILDEPSRLLFSKRIQKWLAGEEPGKNVEYRVLSKDGRSILAELDVTFTTDEQGKPVGATVIGHDITERKRTEERIQSQNTILTGINRILKEALTCQTEEELGGVCLAVAEEITGSKFGFIGEINHQTGQMDAIAISDPGWQDCRIDDQSGNGRHMPIGFKIHGIYGRVLLDNKSFYTNDPDNHPDRIGIPEGNPPLTAFLGTPLKLGKQTIGMIGLGNREGGYGPGELEAAEALAPVIVQAFVSKRGEIALRESEEREKLKAAQLEAVMEALPVGVAITDPKGGNLRSNRAFEELWGDPRPDVNSFSDYAAYKAWWAERGEEVKPQEWASVQAVQKGIAVIGQKMKLRNFDGKTIYILNSASPVKDANGNIAGSAVAVQDITHMQETEQELKEANEHLEQRVLARTQELRVANEELQISNEELEAANAQLLQNSRSLEIQADISHLLIQAGSDCEKVMQLVVKKITEIFGDICILRLISEDGQWLNPVAFYDPDPERYQLLKEWLTPNSLDEDLTGEVFRTGVGKIYSVDDPEDWTKKVKTGLSSYIHKYQMTSVMMAPLHMNHRTIGTLGLTRSSTGKPYSPDNLLLLQELADRISLAIYNAQLFQDLEKSFLTEKMMRGQLIQAEKYAAITRLVGSVAHEINNPLQTVQNCMYLLKHEVQSESARETLEMAVGEGKRISGLVEQLRETYRPAKDYHEENFDLLEVLSKINRLIAPQLRQNNVLWKLEANPKQVTIQGVPDQIKQVFLNICLNAIDAMGTTGGELNVIVSKPESSKKVCITFQDTGPGIQQKYLNQIFEPFFSTKEKGTGLGLSISYEIVKNHGGEITAESQTGQGAVFKVFLPVKVAADENSTDR